MAVITGTIGSVVLGSVIALLGVALVVFRIPLSTAARNGRLKFGLNNAESQTPTLFAVVGTAFTLIGLYLAIGTLTGIVHAHT